MRTQTYFHTKFEREANRRNDTVPLQVNCVGAVSCMNFTTRSVRRDYYYIYVLEGKMILQECELFPGDVMIYEPEHEYQYKNEGETTYLWIHYTGLEAYALTKAAVLQPNVKRHIGVHQEIIDCFEKLFQEFIIHDAAAGQVTLCLLREILYRTGRYVGEDQKKVAPLLAIEYIHGHFREELDVEELAWMEHMSDTAFRIAFRRHTGVSPNEYIIAQRISAACQLLKQTDRSVREIAGDVGYKDQYYFSRIFKKKVGMTPLRYRYAG